MTSRNLLIGLGLLMGPMGDAITPFDTLKDMLVGV